MTDTNRAEPMKPCPFCGGAAELDTRQGYTYAKYGQPRHGTAVAVYCTECTVQFTVCREDVPDIAPEAVIEMWNRRAELEASRLPQAGAGDAAVQQPVAWMYETDAVNDRQSDAGWVPYKVTHIHQNAKFAALNNHTPLYTSPLPTAPADLHPRTNDLVDRFAVALKEKLAAAEKKYGYSDGWDDNGWMDECRAHLVEHVHKGDPRDVAAYCAFLWHHGEETTLEEQFIYDALGKWPGVAALAAAPGARQPLSDERLCELCDGTQSAIAFARAIESEHGITLAPIAGKGDGNG